MKKHLGAILLLITTLFWGGGFVGQKYGADHLGTAAVIALRSVLAVAFLLVVQLVRRANGFDAKTLKAGAICGVAGFMLVAGTDHTISTNTVGGMGFTAIMVSWLAKFNPLVMALTSFLLIFLGRGAGEIATAFRLNESVSDILTGIILFFIIGCEFFVNYKVNFRPMHKEGK